MNYYKLRKIAKESILRMIRENIEDEFIIEHIEIKYGLPPKSTKAMIETTMKTIEKRRELLRKEKSKEVKK